MIYRNLEDKEPHSRGLGLPMRYVSGMSKTSESPWRQMSSCRCIKAELPSIGSIVIRCAAHRGKPSKRCLCYWDADGIVRSEEPLEIAPRPKPEPVAKPRGPRRVRPGQRVYFARLGDLIKIGISEDVEARVKSLNADLIGSIAGGLDLEEELHEEFADLRQRGEWFKAKKRLLARIEELLR